MLSAMHSATFVGILAGTAAGDSWGWPNEFKRLARMNPPMPRRAVITDDTQMSFIVADVVLHELETGCSRAESLRRTLDGFERWRTDVDNDRAPGVATMAALTALSRGHDIASSTQINSKGAGALMRVAPAAALDPIRARSYGLDQAVLTHGHPTSSVACAVMLELVAALGERQLELPDALEAGLEMTDRLTELGVADSIVARFDGDYLATGRRELNERMLEVRERVRPARRIDPAKIAGRTGCAEDVLVGALAALSLRASDPMDALRLCAGSAGDADTVAAVAGALIGARLGPEPFVEFTARLEPRYADELDSLSARVRRTLMP